MPEQAHLKSAILQNWITIKILGTGISISVEHWFHQGGDPIACIPPDPGAPLP